MNEETSLIEIPVQFPYVYEFKEHSSLSNVLNLIQNHIPEESHIVDLGAGSGILGEQLLKLGYRYHGIELNESALGIMTKKGLSCSSTDLTDTNSLKQELDRLNDIKVLCLIDVIEHLVEPQKLLSFLSEYAWENNIDSLVVCVPNITFIDISFKLLLGFWDVSPTGLLDQTHLRFFSNQTLHNLLCNCGWQLNFRKDYIAEYSEQYPFELLKNIPGYALGVISAFAELLNQFPHVYQFIWMLTLQNHPDNGSLTYYEALTSGNAMESAVLDESQINIFINKLSILDILGSTTEQNRLKALIEERTRDFSNEIAILQDDNYRKEVEIRRLKSESAQLEKDLNTVYLDLKALQSTNSVKLTKFLTSIMKRIISRLLFR